MNEAPTKLNNVASTYPIKLAQMKALFDDEAKGNNVYPLINWSDLSSASRTSSRKPG